MPVNEEKSFDKTECDFGPFGNVPAGGRRAPQVLLLYSYLAQVMLGIRENEARKNTLLTSYASLPHFGSITSRKHAVNLLKALFQRGYRHV